MHIYLINPKIPLSFCGNEYACPILFKKYPTPPLSLLTVAGMVPQTWSIEFCDENTQKINWKTKAGLIAITGMHIQKERLREIAAAFQRMGKYVIVGGPSVTASPHWYRDVSHTLVLGEAEYTLPVFFDDFEKGKPKDIYQEMGTVNLKDSPPPRFDLVSPRDYMNMSVQTTRGCPFACDFCDIITLYGREVRTKSIAQTLKELDLLHTLGAAYVFFVDDNLIGNLTYAAELLEAVADWNNAKKARLKFSCQVSLNLSKQARVLKLLYKAGFRSVFIGIETPRQDSLAGALKFQNLNTDIVKAVRKIQENGIMVYSGLVVGFDQDNVSIFDEQADFIAESKIPIALPSQILALPGTPFYHRIRSENRLISESFLNSFQSNLRPKQMSPEVLNQGYLKMIQDIYMPDSFSNRINHELILLEKTLKSEAQLSLWDRFLRVLVFFWILIWFLKDRHRGKLFQALRMTCGQIARRHSQTWDAGLIRLILYRHILCFIDYVKIETGAQLPERFEMGIPQIPEPCTRPV